MTGSALMMAGSARSYEMFGGIILRFTRNVAENDTQMKWSLV